MAALDAAEKAAQEAERDAGRETLLAALAKVKIPHLDRAEAKAIANAIATLGARGLLVRIGTV